MTRKKIKKQMYKKNKKLFMMNRLMNMSKIYNYKKEY